MKLYNSYHDRGLEILAFPCNQFGKQEPKSHEEILAFASKYENADKKFVWFAKTDVNGPKTNQIFTFLKSALPFSDGTHDVRWNFGKFLVGPDGQPIARYGSKQHPMEMEQAIIDNLPREPPAGAAAAGAAAAASSTEGEGKTME
jgi:glutathione peroxidase